MNRRKGSSAFRALLAAFFLCAAMSTTSSTAQEAGGNSRSGPSVADFAQISPNAQQQIRDLLAEKQSRTPAQRKIGSSLIYMMKAQQGIRIAPTVSAFRPLAPQRADGLVDVEIRGKITKPLIEAVSRSGGKPIYGHVNGAILRALLPLRSLETLAARSDVSGIHQTSLAATQQLRKDRAEQMRAPLGSAVNRLRRDTTLLPQLSTTTGSVTSQGVKAHRVDEATRFFGVTGAGIKIGVLSDSDDFKEQSISTGDLPADTVTIPGQSGRPGNGEGTAMMEIVHDVAPGAKLFFATAFNSPESFADNIRALRFVYGCDIIVDDIIYYFESPYQDDIIAKAVEDVIADGAMYFSSAGNQGNFDDGTSGTWEGDFKKAQTAIGALPTGYEIHNFGGGVVSDRIEVQGGPLILHWSDPGSLDNPQSANDYDLFLLDSTLSNVVLASTDVQDGTGLPFEFLGFVIPPDFRVVIARHTGAADRAVRIELFAGELAVSTSGGTYGHSTVNGAYGVAAVDAAQALGGAFVGGATNPVELYSADGNRRVFYNSAGVPYKPGKFLFKNSGGQNRLKPDIAAADGVSTTLPASTLLNPFFGTSAAAPHAAAIAGLLKSAKPTSTAIRLRTTLTKTALDIEGFGRDRDSGFGIIDAFTALTFIGAKPSPFLELGTVTSTPTSGNGDAYIDPGESANIITQLINNGGAGTIGLVGTLSTSTPNVTITSAASNWPTLGPLGGSGSNNTPFTFNLSPAAECGISPEFTLTSSYTNGPLSPQTFTFHVQTGKPGTVPTTTSYPGSPVPIPDDNAAGVNIPFTVSGLSTISKLVFSIDGTTCTAAAGASTVGIDHSWVGDVVIKLTSPSGTTVTLINHAGGTLNSGNNFCQTVLDDAAPTSIQNVTVSGAPYTGTFAPASPLAAFNGETANGTWVLNVSDDAFLDTGTVRAFSLITTGFTCD